MNVNGEAWRQAIDANYNAFIRQLGGLLDKHQGQYALVYDAVVEDIFVTLDEAEYEGRRRHGADQPYSIQPVVVEPDDLGWFSHVAH